MGQFKEFLDRRKKKCECQGMPLRPLIRQLLFLLGKALGRGI